MGYYYDDFPKRRRFFATLLLSLVSAVIGGLLALSLAPQIYGPEYLQRYAAPAQPQQVEPLPVPSTGQDYYSPVVAIAERVGPTVVGISNQGASRSLLKQDLVEMGSGSGVIISQDGYIVTNYHVISGAERLMVSLADGRQIEAEVRGSDPDTDLAVLKISASNLPTAILGDSTAIKTGELVVAIGNPLGYEFARSVTAGVVSAKERNITVQDQKFKLIQTDAAINPGNSGGPLVNARGEVIGINSVKLAVSGVEGMGFAIPISDAQPIINQLIKNGFVSRPSLGIWGIAVDEATARTNNIPQGIYISEIIRGGPAYKSGLTAGDVIVAVNGSKVVTFDDLSAALKPFKVGDQVTVGVWRHGRNLNVELVLSERSKQ